MQLTRSLKQAFLALAIAVMAAAALPATAQQIEEIDTIVAVVDDDIIMRSELDIAIKGIVDRIRAQGGNLPPQDLIEKQVLERLIVRKLQIQRAF